MTPLERLRSLVPCATATDDIDVSAAERERERLMRQPLPDHVYLDPDDTKYSSGDRHYDGCFICGKSRTEHLTREELYDATR